MSIINKILHEKIKEFSKKWEASIHEMSFVDFLDDTEKQLNLLIKNFNLDGEVTYLVDTGDTDPLLHRVWFEYSKTNMNYEYNFTKSLYDIGKILDGNRPDR